VIKTKDFQNIEITKIYHHWQAISDQGRRRKTKKTRKIVKKIATVA
jgi:hypothetical protein